MSDDPHIGADDQTPSPDAATPDSSESGSRDVASSPEAEAAPAHSPEVTSPDAASSAVASDKAPPRGGAPVEDSLATTMDEIDREVAEAMAAMDVADLSELSGVEPSTLSTNVSDSIEPGTELVGTLVGVTADDIFLEFDAKSQGVLPRSQFGKKETLAPGRRVDVVVDRYDEEAGLLIVSRQGSIQRATWINLKIGMLVEGRVTGVIKGGLEVDLKGIRAFMPASQVDIVPMKDVSTLLGEPVQCEVLEFDRRSKNVLVSRRKLQERERAESKEKLKGELEVGQLRKGVVGNIADFGAFVDLGGIDGLIHIRELSWGTVEKVTDVLSPGQEVEVMVLKIDTKRDRISLGLKQALPDPWVGVGDRYPVGERLKVRVVRLADFGAFAELESGVEGLIPISELSWSRTQKTSDVVSIGSMVDAVVIRMDAEKRRLALSVKQAEPDPWEQVLASFGEKDSIAKGRVTNLMDFGAFVELAPGVEGLIHISELSDKHIKSCSEVVKVGDEVTPRVLGVDKENRRISLSLKKAGTSEAMPQPEEAPKKPKKRKKPLRGGLASHYDW